MSDLEILELPSQESNLNKVIGTMLRTNNNLSRVPIKLWQFCTCLPYHCLALEFELTVQYNRIPPLKKIN